MMTDGNRGDNEPILTTGESHHLHLYSLILSAAGISHNIYNLDATHWSIHVSPIDCAKALKEIRAYEEENHNWPLQPEPEDTFSPIFKAHSLLIVVSLMLFHSVTGSWSTHSRWFSAGAVDSEAILVQGEYYRLLTALTLHADLVHLLGNCFLGVFLLHFYFLILGNGIGLFSLLFSAMVANLINVLGHGSDHLSIGFSTAVFSLIGILSALNFRHYRFTQPARLVFPLMAGAALLAMLGSGGERTDLGAHFFGLLTGLAAGTLLGIRRVLILRHNSMLQVTLTISSLSLPLLAWYSAMH